MIPRNEYPRPQLVRKQWMCLNGEWDFFIDNGKKYADEIRFLTTCSPTGSLFRFVRKAVFRE